jgi:hypothetical protein
MIVFNCHAIVQLKTTILRASLGTTFSQGNFIIPKEISSFYLGKLEII